MVYIDGFSEFCYFITSLFNLLRKQTPAQENVFETTGHPGLVIAIYRDVKQQTNKQI